MATILGIDVGSSSVIAGILRGKTVLAESPRAFFKSRCDGPKVEVDPDELLRAVRVAIAGLKGLAKNVDAIHLAVMCPAWVVLDAKGNALTPIVTHQDRRSVAQAEEIEARFGLEAHLHACGCRPFPGGISSTTWAWFKQHEPQRLRRADLVGHLNTFLHRRMTGARVIDPSNASFTGLYRTLTLDGWSDELCANLGVDKKLLPEVHDADRIGGRITPEAARAFGLRAGTPMIVGLMDGSAGMILAGAKVGQLFNVTGSTDVLALCTDRPKPHERLLTRALGLDGKFLQVSTLAAVASAIYWVRDQMYPGTPIAEFQAKFRRLAKLGPKASGSVRFEPYMAGERTSIVQRQGAFTGLTLASTREQMLSAVVESLIRASAERLPLLAASGTPLLPSVAVSGGADRLDVILRRDWPGKWTYRAVTDATMRGLAMLEPKEV